MSRALADAVFYLGKARCAEIFGELLGVEEEAEGFADPCDLGGQGIEEFAVGRTHQ